MTFIDIRKASLMTQMMFHVGIEWAGMAPAVTDKIMNSIGGANGLIAAVKQWAEDYALAGRNVGDYHDDLEEYTLLRLAGLRLQYK